MRVAWKNLGQLWLNTEFLLIFIFRRKVYEMGQLGGGGVDSLAHDGPAGEGDIKKKNKKWGVGEMEFEAMMRMMDNAVSLTPFLLSKFSIVVHLQSTYQICHML